MTLAEVPARDMKIARTDWPRLLELLGQALGLPATERPAWLLGLDLPVHLMAARRSLLEDRQAIEAGDFLSGLPDCAGGRRRRKGRCG